MLFVIEKDFTFETVERERETEDTARKGIQETHKRVVLWLRDAYTHKYKKSCSSFDSDIRRMHCNKFADVATFVRCQLEMN